MVDDREGVETNKRVKRLASRSRNSPMRCTVDGDPVKAKEDAPAATCEDESTSESNMTEVRSVVS